MTISIGGGRKRAAPLVRTLLQPGGRATAGGVQARDRVREGIAHGDRVSVDGNARRAEHRLGADLEGRDRTVFSRFAFGCTGDSAENRVAIPYSVEHFWRRIPYLVSVLYVRQSTSSREYFVYPSVLRYHG
jgi:hypothetical protein